MWDSVVSTHSGGTYRCGSILANLMDEDNGFGSMLWLIAVVVVFIIFAQFYEEPNGS